MHSLQKYEVEPINCQKSELAEPDHVCVKGGAISKYNPIYVVKPL